MYVYIDIVVENRAEHNIDQLVKTWRSCQRDQCCTDAASHVRVTCKCVRENEKHDDYCSVLQQQA
jgi:hypothetical protein